MDEAKRTLERVKNFHYILILEGIAVGAFSGIVIVLFRLAISKAEEYMAILREFASHRAFMTAALFFMIFALAMLCAFLVKKESLISGSGIPQVKGELTDHIETKWYRVLAFKFIGAAAAIGAGLSLGREGPSVQLGAMVGKGFSRITKKLHTEEKLLMTCGAGAGLAAAFNAPLAGVVFSLEELHKNFSEEVLLSTMAAAITSDFVSRYVFGLAPVFAIETPEMLPLKYYWIVILLGILLGVLGVFYNASVKKTQNMYGHIKDTFLRIIIPFIFAAVFSMVYPSVLGGGSNLVEGIAGGEFMLKGLLILLVVKYMYSMLSFASGAPGGIFLPLLVLGSVIGASFFDISAPLLGIDDIYLANFVIFGMAGYFAAIVRAPITGVILISEMTGSLSHLLTLSIVSLAAYVTADILGGKPIYNQLLERILSNRVMEEGRAAETRRRRGMKLTAGVRAGAVDTGAIDGDKKRGGRRKARKVLVETPVHFGSAGDGMRVSELSLPKGTLIVSLTRDGDEIVPYGETVIRGGDRLVVLCDSDETAIVDDILNEKCRKIEI